MNKLIDFSRRAMLTFLIGLVALVTLAVGMYFVVIKPAVKAAVTPAGTGGKLVQAPGVGNVYTDPAAGTVYLVPPSRIPQSQAARFTAPAVTLLADRWQTSNNADTQVGPAQDVARIPAADRQTLMSSVSQFLQAWETFTPPTISQSAAAPQAYLSSLRPWVSPEALSDIANRVDNTQGGSVCPDSGCLAGSSWDGTDVTATSNVRFYNGTQAYVTAYGSVTYHAAFSNSPLDGVQFQRSYGLLLKFSGGRWLVARAVAATDGRNG